MDMESCSHLFLNCPYIKEVWKDCSILVGVPCRWEGKTVGIAWETWWRTTPQKKFKILPLLVIWGVWLARNNLIFHDKSCTLEITSALSTSLSNVFSQHIRIAKQRMALELAIDNYKPWGFFDGVAQNDICGGGALLYLSD
jgi:hypothetical protein